MSTFEPNNIPNMCTFVPNYVHIQNCCTYFAVGCAIVVLASNEQRTWVRIPSSVILVVYT